MKCEFLQEKIKQRIHMQLFGLQQNHCFVFDFLKKSLKEFFLKMYKATFDFWDKTDPNTK